MRWPFSLGFMGGSQESSQSSTSPTDPVHVFEADPNVLDEFNQLAFHSWNSAFASDPSEWERSFSRELDALKKKLVRPCKDVNTLTEVCTHVESMCKLLVMEVNSLPMAAIGPILELVFSHDVFRLVNDWAEQIPTFLVPTCQVLLLRIYQGLVTQNHSQTHCLLVHKPILLPLLQLLQWCRNAAEQRCFQRSRIDKDFVLLLHEICVKISVESTLLDFFFNPRSTDGFDLYEKTQPFLVFNLLIRYLYDSDLEIANQARSALLLILTASKELDFVAKHVAEESNFCPVLATGLSGCYSQLPGFVCEALRLREDEFHKLFVDADFDAIPELCTFHGALLFCNAVVGSAHAVVARQIVNFFYHGFLEEVVKPSLLQSDVDKLVSRIAYFHLCLESVSEPAMIQTILKLLSAAETNVPDMNLLEVILDKMNQSDRLCRAVLSLLRTLLELRSEDFMWSALFRYILPFIRLRPQKQRFEPQVSVDAAKAFLACIPECCLNVSELCSQEIFDAYNAEAYERLRATRRNCQEWAFRYDGLTPNNLLNLNIPEETLSARQPFTRLSSARSSMASNPWNRYFSSRSAHGTTDSVSMYAPDSGRFPLNQLGEDDCSFVGSGTSEEDPTLAQLQDVDLSAEDADEFTSNYELMTQSHIDYLQFAYDELSESDESRHNSVKEEEPHERKALGVPLAPDKLKLIKQVTAKNWNQVKDSIPDFARTLESIEMGGGAQQQSVDAALHLIDARFQHLVELKAELEALASARKSAAHPLKLDLSPAEGRRAARTSGGLLMTCTTEKGAGFFYEALIAALERLVEHRVGTNVQLALVLESLAAYPQPVVGALLLHAERLRGGGGGGVLPRLTRVLDRLRLQVDAFAAGVEGFDALLRRGARHRAAHASAASAAPGTSSTATPANPAPTFRHTRLAAEPAGRERRRVKQFAYAAIVLSQLCQALAAAALQHTPTYALDA